MKFDHAQLLISLDKLILPAPPPQDTLSSDSACNDLQYFRPNSYEYCHSGDAASIRLSSSLETFLRR
jgi:hypothetical protein